MDSYKFDYVLYIWVPISKTYARYQRYDSVNAMIVDLQLLIDTQNVNKFKVFRYLKGIIYD